MPFAAITFRIRRGNDDAIAEIFADFKRLDSSVVRDEQGNEVARLLGTAVFIKDDMLVRVIHYEGDFAAIPRYIATQPGVREVERRIAQFLVEQRGSTPEAFGAFFRDATMRCVYQSSLDDEPATA